MIGFEDFRPGGDSPLYSQITRYIKRGVAAGIIRNGDELPSRRVLSALLGINPNTVQKAYRLLEEEGLIASHGGAKSVMVLDEAGQGRVRRELLAEQARAYAGAMRDMGVEKQEALALIEALWQEGADGP